MEKPESPSTRAFVYRKLIDHFGVYDDSDPRHDGRRRGIKHTESLERLSEVLEQHADDYNAEHPDTPVLLARSVVPKVLHELNVLKIVDYSKAGDKLLYFEAFLFGEGNYVEDHAKDAFRFTPPGEHLYYYGDHKS